MFLLYAVLAGLVAGVLAGGRLEGLGRLEFRWGWVFALGLLVQLVLFSDEVTSWIGAAGVPIYVGSTLAVAAVIAANYRIPGMPVVLAGAVCNLAAIISNGGYMPASAAALATLGNGLHAGYSNSTLLESPNLPWLTDIFALPRWVPFANVFSVGDVLIGVGVVIVMVVAMRNARGGAPAASPPQTEPGPTGPAPTSPGGAAAH